MKAVTFPDGLARYAVPVTALHFIAKHAILFHDKIMGDSAGLFERLLAACKFNNKDVSGFGIFACNEGLWVCAGESGSNGSNGECTAGDWGGSL